MKIRGHGNAVAIALAALALAVAATGTAVAVTTNNVRIADGKTASKLATVDSTGRLATGGYQSSINSSSLVTGTSVDSFLTTPTNAVLAITHLSVDAASSNSGAVDAIVYQVPTLSDGSCSTSSALRRVISHNLAPGAVSSDDYANPLVVRPSGSAKYCLDFFIFSGSSKSVTFNFSAFVVYGTYSAPANAKRTVKLPGGKKLISR